MRKKSTKGGRDHARRAAGDLLDPQPAHQLSGQFQAQVRLKKNDKSTSTRALQLQLQLEAKTRETVKS